jgi:hypothetical protein
MHLLVLFINFTYLVNAWNTEHVTSYRDIEDLRLRRVAFPIITALRNECVTKTGTALTPNIEPICHHQPKCFQTINTANSALCCSNLTVSGKVVNGLQLQGSFLKYIPFLSSLLSFNLPQTLVLNFRIQTLL